MWCLSLSNAQLEPFYWVHAQFSDSPSGIIFNIFTSTWSIFNLFIPLIADSIKRNSSLISWNLLISLSVLEFVEKHIFYGQWLKGKIAKIFKVVISISLPMQLETWVQFLDWEDILKQEMAALLIILTWRIPWAEEPGRLQSMGSRRVGHDWTDTHVHNQHKMSESQAPLNSVGRTYYPENRIYFRHWILPYSFFFFFFFYQINAY